MGAGLNLHPVGLNEEERKILSVAMNVLIAGGCGVRYSEQISQDTVAVIDVDSAEGRDFYESRNSRINVVIASDEGSYPLEGLIVKPLRVQALRNVLSEISEQMLQQNKPDYEVASAQTSSNASSNGTLPNDSLFYALVNAVANKELCRISCGDEQHDLLIHGPSRHIYTDLSRDDLQHAACLSAARLHVAILDDFEFMKRARGLASHRIERILWLASEHGALGHAPAHLNAHDSFRLRDWPRYDVKHAKAEYLTLTAIATRRALSFEILSRITRIPLTTVFDFYHAAKACGVAVDYPQLPKMEPVPARAVPSLVVRIAKKLGLNFF